MAAPEGHEILDLPEFVRKVVERSPELAFARADQEGRRALLRSAQKDLYPSLSARYEYLYQPDDSLSQLGFGTIENSFAYGVTLTQPLYRGGALVSAVELSRLALDGSRAALASATSDLLRRAHEAYYRLLNSLSLVREAEQAVERLIAHRNQARAFYEAGLVPRNDFLQSEVELAQGEQDLLRAESSVQLARAAMNVMMKRPPTAPLAVADEALKYEPFPAEWEESLARALALRPEIAQAELAVRQADRNITLAEAPYRPEVTLTASYTRQGDEPLASSHPFFSAEEKTARATASWKFWSWRQGADRAAAARQELRKTREELAMVIDAVTLGAREAFLNLGQAEKNIAVTRKAIEQAEENFRINQGRFQAQLATGTEVLDAQTLLTRANTNHLTAIYEYNLALIALEWATGELRIKNDETSLY